MTHPPPMKLCSEGDLVALTFDDGPSPENTPQLIAALSELEVPATFFLLGQNAEAHPAIVADLLSAGLAIGVHGWDHADLHAQEDEFIADQLGRTLDLLRSLGADPTLFTPPYAFWDDTLVHIAADLGLHTILRSADPLDWQMSSPEEIVDRTLAQLEPGAIVMLHDAGGTRSATVAAVPRLVWFLRSAAGYQIVDLAQSLGAWC